MDQQTRQTPGVGKLGWQDLLKGLALAAITAFLTCVYDSVKSGVLKFDWDHIEGTVILATTSYLLKNLATPSQTILKLLLPLLLITSVASAQSFFEPVPKVVEPKHAAFMRAASVALPDSFLTSVRPVAIAGAYGYESGVNSSRLLAGAGAGLKRLKWDYTTKKWISQYSFNLLLWAEGSLAPPLAPAFAMGPTVGVLNDNVMFGAAWDFTNRHPVFVVVYSIPTNN